MIRSIAVTTDFSELSVQSFEAAASVARKFGARLRIVHVLPEPEVYTPWQLVNHSPAERERRLAESRRRLAELVREYPSLDAVKAEPSVLCGTCAEAVVEFQKHETIALVVVASHGHTGMDHFPLGSFTARLLEFSRCPVLVFKTRPSPGAGSPASFEPRRILVAHDFSPSSRATLPVVRDWAEAYQAEIRVVFVVDRSRRSSSRDAAGLADYDDRSNAQLELERIIASEWGDLPAEAVVCEGHPAVEILKQERRSEAEMVVMGSRGLSLFRRLEMGSVAERVVHGSRCPVLVVKTSVSMQTREADRGDARCPPN